MGCLRGHIGEVGLPKPRVVALTAIDFRRANRGLTMRDFHLLSALAEVADVTVFTFEDDADNPVRPRPFPGRIERLPRRSPARSAALSLVQRRMFHEMRMDYRRHEPAIADAISRADVVYASMLYAGSYTGELHRRSGRLPGLVVWDTHNYDPDVWRARAATWRGALRAGARLQGGLVTAAMQRAYDASDVVIACSGDDEAKLEHHFGHGKPILLVPNGADLRAWRNIRDKEPKPLTLVLFGSLEQDATRFGAEQFLRDVWPSLLRQKPYRLILTGRSPGPRLGALAAAAPNVELVADPQNITAVVGRGGVVVVPQPYGVGSKIKMYEALASGRPVVASPPALNGLPPEMARFVRVAETPQQWADHVADLTAAPPAPDPDLDFLLQGADWALLGRQLRDAIFDRLQG